MQFNPLDIADESAPAYPTQPTSSWKNLEHDSIVASEQVVSTEQQKLEE